MQAASKERREDGTATIHLRRPVGAQPTADPSQTLFTGHDRNELFSPGRLLTGARVTTRPQRARPGDHSDKSDTFRSVRSWYQRPGCWFSIVSTHRHGYEMSRFCVDIGTFYIVSFEHGSSSHLSNALIWALSDRFQMLCRSNVLLSRTQ